VGIRCCVVNRGPYRPIADSNEHYDAQDWDRQRIRRCHRPLE
jgi:hypothetical protein